jgi:hypothetical protein
MIALTCDFYVFASRVTARFSTVFFSISHIAKTWYVRALFCLLIRHKKSGPFEFRPPSTITAAQRLLTYRRFCTDPREFKGIHAGQLSFRRLRHLE